MGVSFLPGRSIPALRLNRPFSAKSRPGLGVVHGLNALLQPLPQPAQRARPFRVAANGDIGFAPVLRGEPCNRPRLADVPVLMPYPEALRGGSIYETQTILEKPVFARAA